MTKVTQNNHQVTVTIVSPDPYELCKIAPTAPRDEPCSDGAGSEETEG
jgi:hypothetical protein